MPRHAVALWTHDAPAAGGGDGLKPVLTADGAKYLQGLSRRHETLDPLAVEDLAGAFGVAPRAEPWRAPLNIAFQAIGPA